jgi:hypothetical protein
MTTELMNAQPREFAKFGGFQFLHQMEVCFSGLTAVLEKILNSKVQEFPHPTGVLLANVYQNAKAVGALAPDGLLNETYLVMRVLVDAGVSFCYLLEADESEKKKYLAQTPSSTHLKSGAPEDLLRQAKSTENIDAIPPHQLRSIRERIEVLANKGTINGDAWLMVVASVFPHSSELLSGERMLTLSDS